MRSLKEKYKSPVNKPIDKKDIGFEVIEFHGKQYDVLGWDDKNKKTVIFRQKFGDKKTFVSDTVFSKVFRIYANFKIIQ